MTYIVLCDRDLELKPFAQPQSFLDNMSQRIPFFSIATHHPIERWLQLPWVLMNDVAAVTVHDPRE